MTQMNDKDDYNKLLINMVKAAGQELIDRADEIVGSTKYRTDFYITLDFPMGKDAEAPTIEVVNKSLLKEALDVYIDHRTSAIIFKEEVK